MIESTHEIPANFWNVLNSVDWLHVNCVGDTSIGDPDGTDEMSPFGCRRLLEGAVRVWTQNTALRYSISISGR